MNLKQKLIKLAQEAQAASRKMLAVPSHIKDRVLREAARALRKNKAVILKANLKDLKQAERSGLSAVFLDRLALNDKRIQDMAVTLEEVAGLPDPVGEVIKDWRRPNGLHIQKVRSPIGVIAIIYESRPNVTADCLSLCFKSGNSLILRGGSESLNSNLAIYQTIKRVMVKNNIPQGALNLVATCDRRAIDLLLQLNDYIDLVMPRGGEGLIRRVERASRIPVIKHYKGICHVYVDKYADLGMARKICFNAKVERPGVCNAMESMLVHKDIAGKFLPAMLKKLQARGVEIRGCKVTRRIGRGIKTATEKDYRTEYLDLILSVKVVADLEEAIRRVNFYGSHHSDSIVTKNKSRAREFLKRVDSACVYVNASTRFTDGYQFGMGAEIGISTDKLHARGPMALEELTTYKYEVWGKG